MRFSDRVVVITGTGSGMGRVAAMQFAAEGARVYGCDRNPEANAETAEIVKAAGGTFIDGGQVDLTQEAATASWFETIARTESGIDVLYANAGATKFNAIDSTDLTEWRWVLQHELDLVFLPIKHAWPLLKRNSGNVILVGSTAGVSGSITNNRLAHSATKGGVIAMAKQVAAEGSKFGIRANSISPGMIQTPATEGDLLAADHPMRKIAEHIPLGRVADPIEVVKCAMFLASDDASYVTGANLMVDGGWSAVLPG